MCASIEDNFLNISFLKPSENDEIIIREDIPNDNPITLSKEVKEMIPKVCLLNRCLYEIIKFRNTILSNVM